MKKMKLQAMDTSAVDFCGRNSGKIQLIGGKIKHPMIGVGSKIDGWLG